MGEELLEKVFGKTAVRILEEQSDAIRVSQSSESLGKDLAVLADTNISKKSGVREINVTKKILDSILLS